MQRSNSGSLCDITLCSSHLFSLHRVDICKDIVSRLNKPRSGWSGSETGYHCTVKVVVLRTAWQRVMTEHLRYSLVKAVDGHATVPPSSLHCKRSQRILGHVAPQCVAMSAIWLPKGWLWIIKGVTCGTMGSHESHVSWDTSLERSRQRNC